MYQVPASLVLSDDRDTIVVRPAQVTASDPIICKQWDLGSPEVRATAAPRTSADGTYDDSAFTGSRTVTLDLQVFGDGDGSPYAYVERLAAIAHPMRRPTLTIQRPTVDTGGDVWTMALRGNPFSVAYGKRAAALLEMQLSFTAPLGYLEGPLRRYDSATAGAAGSPDGLSFPIDYPIDFGTGPGDNPGVTFMVASSTPLAPVVAIYGPVVNPEVRSDDGQRFVFSGLTLASGQVVVVDMDAGTVRIGGSVDASVYHLVDFSVSTFWTWEYGMKTVRLIASSGSMTVEFKERRLTL